MSDPLKTLLINHNVFPLDEKQFDVLYSALKSYVNTRILDSMVDSKVRDEAMQWEPLDPIVEVKKNA